MKDSTQSFSPKRKEANKVRKPFVAPQLRQEAKLTRLTAERTFTFGGGS